MKFFKNFYFVSKDQQKTLSLIYNIRKNILLEPNKNYLNLYDNDFSSEKENLLILKFGKKNIFGHTE